MRRLESLALVAFAAGVPLMIFFEATITRIAGMSLLLAFIVLGVFAVASPEYLAAEGDGADADPRGE